MQMTKEPINTVPLEKFFQQVKVAEQSNSKDVRLSIADAKVLALTVGQINARLLGDMEQFISNKQTQSEQEVINVEMDGGGFKD